MSKKKQPTANVEWVNQYMSVPQINVGLDGLTLVRNDPTDIPFALRNRGFGGPQVDPRRDIDQECGYLLTEELTSQAYKDMYDRESIATRVVQVMSKECWQVQPSVFEDDDTEISTPFEVAWDALAQHLRGTSWHKDEDAGNPVWEYLQRADMLSGIGHFGLILLGIDDGAELSDPIEGFENGYPDNKKDSPNQKAGVAKFGSVGLGSGLGTDQQYGKMTTFGGDQDSYIHNKTEPMGYKEAREATRNLRRQGLTVTMHLAGGCNHKDSEPVINAFKESKDEWYLRISRGPTINFSPQNDDEDTNYNATKENIPEQEVSAEAPPDDESVVSQDDEQPDEEGMIAGEGEDMQEAEVVQEVETKRKLLYMRVFDESLVQITRYEADTTNPRFGQPVMYLVTINDPKEMHSGIGLTTATLSVHWSRVIHVADNLNSSEVFGVPRMRPVWNRLCDLKKLYGGSAEMYWKAAFMGLALETHPQLGGDVQLDVTGLRQQLERYQNSLQRYLAIEGTHVNPLAPQVVSPAEHIDKEIEAICVQIGCPKRVFMGSEQGELASSQDSDNWNGRVKERQTNYLTPKLVVPFVDRLIMIEVLPEPTQYKMDWPDLETEDAATEATVALQKTQAIAAYMTGGADALIAPQDYLVHILGFDEAEAESILDNTHQHLAEANPDVDPNTLTPGKQPMPEAPIDPQTGQEAPMSPDGTVQFAPQPEQHTHTGDSEQHIHTGDSHFNAGGNGEGQPPVGATADKASKKGSGKLPPTKPSRF